MLVLLNMNWVVSLISRALERAIIKLIRENGGCIMATIEELEVQIGKNVSAEAAAVLLIQGFAARLDAAGVDPVKLDQLRLELYQSAANLEAAVAANQPEVP